MFSSLFKAIKNTAKFVIGSLCALCATAIIGMFGMMASAYSALQTYSFTDKKGRSKTVRDIDSQAFSDGIWRVIGWTWSQTFSGVTDTAAFIGRYEEDKKKVHPVETVPRIIENIRQGYYRGLKGENVLDIWNVQNNGPMQNSQDSEVRFNKGLPVVEVATPSVPTVENVKDSNNPSTAVGEAKSQPADRGREVRGRRRS